MFPIGTMREWSLDSRYALHRVTTVGSNRHQGLEAILEMTGLSAMSADILAAHGSCDQEGRCNPAHGRALSVIWLVHYASEAVLVHLAPVESPLGPGSCQVNTCSYVTFCRAA